MHLLKILPNPLLRILIKFKPILHGSRAWQSSELDIWNWTFHFLVRELYSNDRVHRALERWRISWLQPEVFVLRLDCLFCDWKIMAFGIRRACLLLFPNITKAVYFSGQGNCGRAPYRWLAPGTLAYQSSAEAAELQRKYFTPAWYSDKRALFSKPVTKE